MNGRGFTVLLLATCVALASGCLGREGLCERVCKKSFDCDDDDDAHRDLSDCNNECELMTEETNKACAQEFRRLSKCYNRRFDCDGQHYDSCRRRRDQLNACLNAQDN